MNNTGTTAGVTLLPAIGLIDVAKRSGGLKTGLVAALFETQGWNALARHTLGVPYLEEQFESAWQSVLFSHFHDILTGSCVQESREHAMGQFTHAMAVAGSRESLAMQQIARAINTSVISIEDTQSEGAGAGYGLPAFNGVQAPERGREITRILYLFNSSEHDRNDVCEITVWDWTGDLRYLKVEDCQGNELSFQLLDHSFQQYWDHKFFRILVKTNVPAFGYTTIVLKEKEIEKYAIYLQPEERSNKPHHNFALSVRDCT